MTCKEKCRKIKGIITRINLVKHHPFDYRRCTHCGICIPKSELENDVVYCSCCGYKLARDGFSNKGTDSRRNYLQKNQLIKRIE